MLKRDTLGTASAKSLGEAFKCGECLHHTQTCHPAREQVCSKLGVRAFAIAPKCFTPDVTKVIQNAEQFAVLSSLFNSYSVQQRRIMIGILRGAKTKESGTKNGKKHFKFGTKLYLRLGKDVIANYRCGYVVGYTSSGELILAGSADRKSAGSTFFAYLKTSEGLLTHKEWEAKKKQLIAENKLNDMKLAATPAHLDKYLSYEVPTIDTSPQFFEKPKKRKSARTTELTDIYTVS